MRGELVIKARQKVPGSYGILVGGDQKWFSVKGEGICFPDTFKHIPNTTLALIAIVVECALNSWHNGTRSQVKFSEMQFRTRYQFYMKKLECIQKDCPNWMKQFKKDLYESICKKSGHELLALQMDDEDSNIEKICYDFYGVYANYRSFGPLGTHSEHSHIAEQDRLHIVEDSEFEEVEELPQWSRVSNSASTSNVRKDDIEGVPCVKLCLRERPDSSKDQIEVFKQIVDKVCKSGAAVLVGYDQELGQGCQESCLGLKALR
ncbi:hypothetical protein DEU56DRAFT_750447 [Suillus clintonianus]|uniref:uncharacterized protein n=1 Tax=Suillus clintonianus TaxID=1904413 RepID=UPI001B8853A5|nr:uncharacterized protein DEU56DRAFT_750447 [Suillus clintonianus]KAG2157309.1 hypothetical protein DEU56DRAFT_750447 [Suillus clintonianus]